MIVWGKIVFLFMKLEIDFPSSFRFNSIDNIGQSERHVSIYEVSD